MQAKRVVTAPLSLEEVDASLCPLGYCGSDTHKRQKRLHTCTGGPLLPDVGLTVPDAPGHGQA